MPSTPLDHGLQIALTAQRVPFPPTERTRAQGTEADLALLQQSSPYSVKCGPLTVPTAPWMVPTHLNRLSGSGKAEIVTRHHDGHQFLLQPLAHRAPGGAHTGLGFFLNGGCSWVMVLLGHPRGAGRETGVWRQKDNCRFLAFSKV